MIRHVVLLELVETATADQRQAALDALSELPALIPEIVAYRFGEDAGLADGNADLAITADFASPEDYLVYAQHPEHVRVITDTFAPIVARRTAAQFEF